ncbi:MAG: hypothetical protein CMF31_04935 [Kordiimonas sp.]|nr:hypothetical protein [Kordiimonas sp.]|tara:strand:+ start:1446 stop:2045 length:600 start_codon:yes stop_codon:yes gene_type:complete
MKKAAQLSSRLLARKGEAIPSPGATNFDPLAERLRNAGKRPPQVDFSDDAKNALLHDNDTTQETVPSSTAVVESQGVRKQLEKARATFLSTNLDKKEKNAAVEGLKSSAEPASATSAQDITSEQETVAETVPDIKIAPAGKRVAMTLRMESEQHLKLRLFSAHTNKSCQDILTKALDAYLDAHQQDIGASNCPCLNTES